MNRFVTRILTSVSAHPVLAAKMDSLCDSYRVIREKSNYDHITNGERWLLAALARKGRLGTVFDVGANRGDSTASVLEVNPQATVHCFEICKPTFETLSKRFSKGNVILNPCGLSDAPGTVEIKYCLDGDMLSSMFEVVCSDHIQMIPGKVMSGKDYCAEHGIGHIDFLKLDVEGAEHLVLKGFDDLLEPARIPVIQFEYGMVNISTKFLLRDFHELLEGRGYRVGKLFPTSVRFREYRFTDEDFRGPNYVAASPEAAADIASAGAAVR